jgi:SAM-dependent methyltransferase
MDMKELPDRAFARHPWEMARAAFFTRLLREHVRGNALCALDIGAGDGYVATRLLADFPAVASAICFDRAYDAAWLESKAEPGLTFTSERPADKFDLVLLLDVLEHVSDDQAVLHEAATCFAKPGAWLLLSAPAHPALFSRHDELLEHKRRYKPARLRDLASEEGLDVVAHGQLFASLLVPRTIAKLGEVARKHEAAPPPPRIETPLGTWHHGPVLTSATKAALAFDNACSRFAARWRIPLPGLSTWVLAHRQ